jgi:uncharacterized protein
MRLRASRIEALAQRVIDILEAEKFIEIIDRHDFIQSLQGIIIADLQKEDQLDEDVRKILDQYADKMDQDRIQYHDMFRMVKEKLAKERNMIL